jgi:hypothetical protein
MLARVWQPAGRLLYVPCSHDGFHDISSSYDRLRGELVYFWVCERCGDVLEEANRAAYRPAYDPHGHERCRGSDRLEHTDGVPDDLPHPTLVQQQVSVPQNL